MLSRTVQSNSYHNITKSHSVTSILGSTRFNNMSPSLVYCASASQLPDLLQQSCLYTTTRDGEAVAGLICIAVFTHEL